MQNIQHIQYLYQEFKAAIATKDFVKINGLLDNPDLIEHIITKERYYLAQYAEYGLIKIFAHIANLPPTIEDQEDLAQALIYAARRNDVALMQLLLAIPVVYENAGLSNNAALRSLAYFKNHEMIRYLLTIPSVQDAGFTAQSQITTVEYLFQFPETFYIIAHSGYFKHYLHRFIRKQVEGLTAYNQDDFSPLLGCNMLRVIVRDFLNPSLSSPAFQVLLSIPAIQNLIPALMDEQEKIQLLKNVIANKLPVVDDLLATGELARIATRYKLHDNHVIKANLPRFATMINWEPCLDISRKLLDLLAPDNPGNRIAIDYAIKLLHQHSGNPPNLYLIKYVGSDRSALSLLEAAINQCKLQTSGAAAFLELLLEKSQTKLEYNEYLLGKIIIDAHFFMLETAHHRPDQPFIMLYEHFSSRMNPPVVNDLTPYYQDIAPQDAFYHHFHDFPEDEIWRLFIDARLQKRESGWLNYESREPGALMAMLHCLQFLEQHMLTPVTPLLLKQIHSCCSTNVGLQQASDLEPGEFRDMQHVRYGLGYNFNLSLLGLFELHTFLANTDLMINRIEIYKNKHSWVSDECNINYINRTVQEMVDTYNLDMSEYNLSITEKFRRIITLIIELERFHPFPDVNCRTFCIFLLNRELMRHGFMPVILENPNFFDGYCINEVCNGVIEGMKNFIQVKNGMIFGLSNVEISAAIHDNDLQATWNALQNPELECQREQIKLTP